MWSPKAFTTGWRKGVPTSSAPKISFSTFLICLWHQQSCFRLDNRRLSFFRLFMSKSSKPSPLGGVNVFGRPQDHHHRFQRRRFPPSDGGFALSCVICDNNEIWKNKKSYGPERRDIFLFSLPDIPKSRIWKISANKAPRRVFPKPFWSTLVHIPMDSRSTVS